MRERQPDVSAGGEVKKTGFVPHNKIEAFMYILLRDHLPSGVVEKIMVEHVEPDYKDVEYSNEFGYAAAKDLAKRLI